MMRIKTQRLRIRAIYELLRDSILASMDGSVVTRGAALSFYTVFAIAPLFVIVLAIAGFWFGEEAARRELFAQVSALVGNQGGDAIQALVTAAHKPKTGTWATVVALITLVVGATGVFVQLQDALNAVWGVRRVAGRGLQDLIKIRLLSLALVMGIGFLLLVSLVLSAALSALGTFMAGSLPGQATIWQGINFIISFGVITLLFAMIFKVLPDVKIPWRDVWTGAVITALLFNLGKLLPRPLPGTKQFELRLRSGRLPGHRFIVGILLGADFVFRRQDHPDLFRPLRLTFQTVAGDGSRGPQGP
jgi:membrane protein